MAQHPEVGRLAQPMRGRCLCGAVSVEVTEIGEGAGACHCDMCRRWTGSVFVVFAAPADAVTVTGAVARHASSDFAERAFCPRCGSHLWWRRTDAAGARYDLMPGLFDATADWPMRSEIYADQAPAYARFPGDHPRRTAAQTETPAADGGAS